MSKFKTRFKYFIIITILAIAFIITMSPLIVKADIDDRSVLYSYASQVIEYPSNQGFIVDKTIDLNSKNVDVYKGYVNYLNGNSDDSKKYCLYELFGEDIHWYRYMGEATYSPTLLDHIWSAVDQDKVNDLSITDIFYSAPNYLSCHVYQNRPTVLTMNDIDSGNTDPRVLSIYTGWFNGYSYVSGSVSLTIAKFIVSIVSILVSHTLLDKIVEVINDLETTSFWLDIMRPIIWFLIAGVTIFFIISLVSKAKNYTTGRGSAREFFARFLVGFMCIGFTLAATFNPTVLNNIALGAATIVDQLFEASLSSTVDGDEVVDVSDDDLVMQAVLWKTAIFGPWCRGQFDGLEYNQLYTNYAALSSDSGKSAMPQSNETPEDLSEDKDSYFNSTALTGDVTVPIGNGANVKNWAAYLYSCGSKYHIDYSLDVDTAAEIDLNAEVQFPTANTTYNNKELMADTFRVIDAQMDISPQYFEGGVSVNNYTNSHRLTEDFMMQGTVAIFNSLLLFVLIPAIWQKIKNFILLIVTTIKIIYFTILEVFKEGNGKEFWSSLKDSFLGYFIADIKICILITLYTIFADKGIFMAILFIVISIVVYGFNVQDVKQFIREVKNTRDFSHGMN